ncbi:hypothetical protein, partial [uncultured Prevotella sp.]|uniref:hypothetical protein n=1 Tax=uncultured Prevotella sp. TaxID=159272 RepID=UPI002611B661
SFGLASVHPPHRVCRLRQVLPEFVFLFNFAPGLRSLAEQASRTFVLNGQRFLNRRLDSI